MYKYLDIIEMSIEFRISIIIVSIAFTYHIIRKNLLHGSTLHDIYRV